MRPTLILAALLLFSPVCTAQNQKASAAAPDREGQARMPIEGSSIFQYRCATCHGADGRGHGPQSAALKHAVPNLTLIARRNGGKFPYQQVKEVIEGKRQSPLAYGYRQVPIYGPIFHQIEADQDWGEVRLDAIIKQVESIQQK
jgi:mono/diheme cytochrome c family protein